MSLVICSNDIPKGMSGTSQFQAPFSWSNHLQQPLRIPPKSSIAVSSLKINKDGTYSVGPANKWYGYYGKELTAAIPLEETTSAPCLTDLGIDRNQDVTTDELAVLIQDGMNRGVPNPETFGMATCKVERDAATQEFKGFKSEFSARGDGSALNNIPQTWKHSFPSTAGGLTFDPATNRLTAKTINSNGANVFNVAIGTDTPLALNKGEYIIQTDKAVNTSWCMGLTRSCTLPTGAPEYFNPNDTMLIRNANLFGDFIVGAFQKDKTSRQVRVYHAVYDTTRPGHDGEKPLSMIEIDYTTGGGFSDEIIQWDAAAAAKYTKFKMDVHMEKMRVQMWNGASWDTLVDRALANPAATKGKIFKPVADTCRNLYPMAFISSNKGGSPVADRYLTVEKFSGRVIDGMTYGKTDWWGRLEELDYTRKYGLQVDTRPYNDAGTALTHTYQGIDIGGFPFQYDFVLVIKPDEVLYKETEQASASVMLGFPNIPVLYSANITANASGGGFWVSLVAPELRSTTSLFVRLNSLPVNTFNAGTSGQSKIIYSAPRFSTGTDKSTGAMFYESPQRTYVSLNNSTELIVNTFDIDIVNADETVASDLLGKSVVVLHIKRDSELS